MSGNCAIGIDATAMAPASVITIAITIANRGRSMKIAENMSSVLRGEVRRHDLAGMDLLYSLDNDKLALFKALGRNDVTTLLNACRDSPLLHFFIRTDNHHVVAGLIEL